MTDEVRYWNRLGIYVSREFAEEYIDKTRYTAEIETVVADALGLDLGEDSTEDSSDGEE